MIYYIFKAAITVVAVLIAMRCAPPIYLSSIVSQKQNLFTVSGNGSVSTVPDIAVISAGVTSQDKNFVKAQERTNTKVANVLAALERLQIEKKDLQTDQYSVNPQYSYDSKPRKLVGYQVSNQLTIKIVDLNKINDVITSMTELGANNVSNIRFTVEKSKRKKLGEEAREKAIEQAKEKANSLAKAAGMQLGPIVDIQEGSSSSYLGGVQRYAKVLSESEASPSIQAGSTDIRSSITLTYEVR